MFEKSGKTICAGSVIAVCCVKEGRKAQKTRWQEMKS